MDKETILVSLHHINNVKIGTITLIIEDGVLL